MKKISKNITFYEATKSDTAIKLGIDNTPDAEQLANMKNIAEKMFEPLRKGLGNKSIGLSNFFRSKELNKKIPGSSTTSQHCKGEAIDIDADIYPKSKITNAQIFHYIKNNLEFDQLIWEYGDDIEPAWVHASLKRNGKNRKMILRIK